MRQFPRCRELQKGQHGHYPDYVKWGSKCFTPKPPRYPRWRRLKNDFADTFAGMGVLDMFKLAGRAIGRDTGVLLIAGHALIMIAITLIVHIGDWAVTLHASRLVSRAAWAVCLTLAYGAAWLAVRIWARRERLKGGAADGHRHK